MRAHMMRKDAQATIWEKVCANHTTKYKRLEYTMNSQNSAVKESKLPS